MCICFVCSAYIVAGLWCVYVPLEVGGCGAGFMDVFEMVWFAMGVTGS